MLVAKLLRTVRGMRAIVYYPLIHTPCTTKEYYRSAICFKMMGARNKPSLPMRKILLEKWWTDRAGM
jgi:hypothetical protein